MKSIKTLLLMCITMAAVGAFAIQYPGSASQGSMPSAQSPQMQTPSNPGSVQPGQPQATQPDQQSQAQPQQQAGRPSIEDQVKMLTQELSLSADQQSKMKSALEEQHQQATTIINDTSLAREDKIQKIRSLRESTITRVRSMLNDDQKKKLDAMLQESDRTRQGGGSTSPSSTSPGNSGTSSPSSTNPGSSPSSTSPSSPAPAGNGRPPR